MKCKYCNRKAVYVYIERFGYGTRVSGRCEEHEPGEAANHRSVWLERGSVSWHLMRMAGTCK